MSSWDNLRKEDQEKIVNVNYFLCGLHFLLGLADQVETS